MANKVHVDLGTEDRDNVGKLMGAIGGFIEGKLHGADEVTKQNLKQVRAEFPGYDVTDSPIKVTGRMHDFINNRPAIGNNCCGQASNSRLHQKFQRSPQGQPRYQTRNKTEAHF